MHAPDAYDISAVHAEDAPSPVSETARPSSRLLRLQLPEGLVAWAELPAPGLDGHDDATVVAVVADLLRAGWSERARPVHPPVLRDGWIFRGFTLERTTTLLPGIDGPVPLRLLLPARLEAPFNWHRATDALDAFHRTFLPAPSHV